MIAIVPIGPEELAEILRDYCDARGYSYVMHGITEEDLIELHIDLPTQRLQITPTVVVPTVTSASGVVAADLREPASLLDSDGKPFVPAPPVGELSASDMLDPAATPGGTRQRPAGAPPETDDELAELMRAKLPASSQRVNPPIVVDPKDNERPF